MNVISQVIKYCLLFPVTPRLNPNSNSYTKDHKLKAGLRCTRLKSKPCCFKLKWCQLNNDFTSYKFLLLKSRNLYGGKVVNHLN